MNILIVGSGAREHAIAWKLRHDPRVERLYVAPGNGGTAAIATNIPVAADDITKLAQAGQEHRIDLTFVGPEVSLAWGIVDHFQKLGLPIFGPNKAAAEIEWSKAFSKSIMLKHRIPTAKAELFTSYPEAQNYIEKSTSFPVVVKADGLATGKGVIICNGRDEARKALHEIMEARAFGTAGEKVLIEECLVGREVSVFAFTDGTYISPIVAACDYKRAFDGGLGPNTGGMGSYSPPEFWDEVLSEQIMERIIKPTVRAMKEEGRVYRGVLYAGLMLTSEGPKALEFNCRLGDPETQVILPRLTSSLVDVAQGVLEETLDKGEAEWNNKACVGVVVASSGYPGEYQKGFPIEGLDASNRDVLVFHAGTKLNYDSTLGTESVVTDGGRVLTVVGVGDSLSQAREQAYIKVKRIKFSGVHWRSDICAKVG